MKSQEWIEKIKDEESKELARKAVDQERSNILTHLIKLEGLLKKEENDLIIIGKQRAYRNVRQFIQS